MASYDFILDLTEKLKAQGFEFLLVTMDRQKNGQLKTNAIHNIETPDGLLTLADVCDAYSADLMNTFKEMEAEAKKEMAKEQKQNSPAKKKKGQ